MALPTDPSGSPIPVTLVAGIDGIGNPQALSVDSFGGLRDPQVRELLGLILMELRGLRLATVAIATDGGRFSETEFDPAFLDDAIHLP